jgi:hypothetical protein
VVDDGGGQDDRDNDERDSDPKVLGGQADDCDVVDRRWRDLRWRGRGGGRTSAAFFLPLFSMAGPVSAASTTVPAASMAAGSK